jgi:hypothetical protein
MGHGAGALVRNQPISPRHAEPRRAASMALGEYRAAAAARILTSDASVRREDARVGASREKVKEQVKEREAALEK